MSSIQKQLQNSRSNVFKELTKRQRKQDRYRPDSRLLLELAYNPGLIIYVVN